MTVVIDQRDIQRKGGRAAKYPSSYIIYSILTKYNLHNVLDVTYGRGRFYYYRKPRLLVAADPKVWDWVVEPDIFIPKPVWALEPVLKMLNTRFDVIVCDPPAWEKGVHYNRRDEYSFVLGSAELIIEETIKLARRLEIRYMLLHYNKTIDLPIIENVEFRYIARYLNNQSMKTTYFTLYEVK